MIGTVERKGFAVRVVSERRKIFEVDDPTTAPDKEGTLPTTPRPSGYGSFTGIAECKTSTDQTNEHDVEASARHGALLKTPARVEALIARARATGANPHLFVASTPTTTTAPATFSHGQLNKKKSSVADLRQSFENLTNSSSQGVVRQLSLHSHKSLPKPSPLETRNRSSTIPHATPCRTVSLAGPILKTPSAVASQDDRPQPDSRRIGKLSSSTEVRSHPDYSYGQLKPVSSASDDTVVSQVLTKSSPSLLGAERPTVPTRKSSIPPPGPFHPFLRQQNSSVNKFSASKKPAKTVVGVEAVKTSGEQHHPDGSHKVKELTKIYESPDVARPASDWEHPNAAAIQDAFNQLLAIGVANKSGPKKKAKLSSDVEGDTRAESPSRLRNKLRKKKHISPLKEKVSMFESLNRPVSRLGGKLSSRARSFETGAVLKRGSEEVTNGIKKLAENGTRMWRRLSSSFEKEREKHTSVTPADDVPQMVESKTSSFKVLSTDFEQQQPTHIAAAGFPPNSNHVITPRDVVRHGSTFLLEGTGSRIPTAIRPRHGQNSTTTRSQSCETSDSTTSEIRDFAVDGFQEPRVRAHASHPVLPRLDFDVDGTPDMVGYFERNFDINFFSVSERSTTTINMGGGTPNHSRFNTSRNHPGPRSCARPPTNSAIPAPTMAAPTIPPRHPGRLRSSGGPDSPSTNFSRKSHASPVLSIHSAPRGDTARTRYDSVPRRRRKPALSAGALSQQRVWDTRRSGATPRLEVVRSEEEMIYTAHLARPIISVRGERRTGGVGGSGLSENDAPATVPVVAGVECGLAHPRPSRVLNLKRFVGYCRERSLALGQKL